LFCVLAARSPNLNETKGIKVFKLKHLQLKPVGTPEVDAMPNTAKYTQSRTELIDRLNAELCEYCGIDTGYFEAHRVLAVRCRDREPPFAYPPLISRVPSAG
jgi:RNA-directed DNA polymerase